MKAQLLLIALAGCGRLDYDPQPSPEACSREPSGGVIAEYRLESLSSGVEDQRGSQSGLVVGTPELVEGRCGNAVRFVEDSYLVIPNSDAWQLEIGSIDFWVFLPENQGTLQSLVSRDAHNAELPGHFTVTRTSNGRLAARIQTDQNGAATAAFVCSAAAVPVERWVHVGVNFGEPAVELFVDGSKQEGTGMVDFTSMESSFECGQVLGHSIRGNDNPWVVGASSHRSEEGQAEPILFPAVGTRIDEFRISNERRDFSTI